MKKILKAVSVSLFSVVMTLSGCVSVPDGISPVSEFDSERYLGTWYEIARLDHRFERGLYNVTATYSKNDNGTIKVQNRGYEVSKEAWKDATGKAKFVDDPTTAHLKVSFFGPIYGSYIVYELGEDYDYAFISGYNKKSLWLLAREPFPPEEVMAKFRETATNAGFDLSGLIDDVQQKDLPR